jgi:RNA polymerase sigma-70 factor (ECF subfamily)
MLLTCQDWGEPDNQEPKAGGAMPAADANERLTHLFEEHYEEVLAYCTRRIGPSDASDVAAEVFAVAWRRIDEVRWETARPWLYGIARGVIANRWRSIRRWSRLNRKLAHLSSAPVETPELYYVRREQDREVVSALSRLRPADQEVLRLAAWEGLSSSEMAEVLGISVAAAEQRLHRAKGRLARVLRPVPEANAFSPRAAEEGGGRT